MLWICLSFCFVSLLLFVPCCAFHTMLFCQCFAPNDSPRCGLINALLNPRLTLGSSLKTHVSRHRQMNPFILSWKLFLLLKNRACRRFGEGGGTFLPARPQSMFHIRDTSYFMSFYQEDGQEYRGCMELVKPQAKNTFMCHDWGCSSTPIACIEMILCGSTSAASAGLKTHSVRLYGHML